MRAEAAQIKNFIDGRLAAVISTTLNRQLTNRIRRSRMRRPL
jgi:hypothetical protein